MIRGLLHYLLHLIITTSRDNKTLSFIGLPHPIPILVLLRLVPITIAIGRKSYDGGKRLCKFRVAAETAQLCYLLKREGGVLHQIIPLHEACRVITQQNKLHQLNSREQKKDGTLKAPSIPP